MENNTNFNKQQFDGLSDLIEMGLGSSAEILSKLLNNEAEFGLEELNNEQIETLESFGDSQGVVVGLDISGAINGKSAIVVQNSYVKEILNVLMNIEEDEDEDEELDEISLGTFKELIGQMASAFSETMTSFFGSAVKIRTDEAYDLSEDGEEIAEFFECDKEDDVYSMVSRFTLTDILSGNFVILFDDETINHIISRIMNPDAGNFYTPDDMSGQAAAPRNSTSVVRDSSLSVQSASFPSFAGAGGGIGGIPLLQGNIDLLMDVPLNVTIEIGKTRKKMRDIMEFAQGTIIDLEKQAGAPVDVVVNGQLVARGDVVVIDDNFGVRITEIIGLGNNNQAEKK